MRRLMKHLCAVAVIVLVGCDDQAGVPQPEPVPLVTLLRSTNAAGVEEVELVGLPGAVPDVGQLSIETSQGKTSTTTTAAGSFALAIEVSGEETITLQYETRPPVKYSLKTGKTPLPGVNFVTPITPPTASFAVNAPDGSTVIVANFGTGVVVEAQAVGGIVNVAINASKGDELHVYLDGDTLSEPVIITV